MKFQDGIKEIEIGQEILAVHKNDFTGMNAGQSLIVQSIENQEVNFSYSLDGRVNLKAYLSGKKAVDYEKTDIFSSRQEYMQAFNKGLIF